MSMRALASLCIVAALSTAAHALPTLVIQPKAGRAATVESTHQTKDATPDSAALRFEIEAPGLYLVDCDYLGRGAQADALMLLRRRGLAVKSAGAVTLAGTQSVGTDLGAKSWKATLGASGPAIEARVTGAAATDVTWSVRCSVEPW